MGRVVVGMTSRGMRILGVVAGELRSFLVLQFWCPPMRCRWLSPASSGSSARPAGHDPTGSYHRE